MGSSVVTKPASVDIVACRRVALVMVVDFPKACTELIHILSTVSPLPKTRWQRILRLTTNHNGVKLN